MQFVCKIPDLAGNDQAIFSGLTKDGVQVVVYVTDHGEPGPDAGDYIAVYYDISPQFEPPTWDGNLVKGNIQIHKDK